MEDEIDPELFLIAHEAMRDFEEKITPLLPGGTRVGVAVIYKFPHTKWELSTEIDPFREEEEQDE